MRPFGRRRHMNNKMMNKRGEIGEFILMMYRLVLISLSALVLVGVSAFVYSYDINIRNSEAEIMNVQLVNCLAEKPYLLIKEDKNSILSDCGFLGDLSRYYVKISVVNLVDEELFLFWDGDSGISWIKELGERKEELKRYRPGYSKRTYDVDLSYLESNYGDHLKINFDDEIRLVVEVYVNDN